MRHWFDAMSGLGLEHGSSFDLDFHTIPFHGEDALVEKHYVSKRSRRQKGILAFLAQDGEKRFFCYANSDLRKDQQDDEILQFVRFWKQRTGKLPEELIFDSKLTTHANLNKLDRQGVKFITLRRRGPKLLDELLARPRSAWRRITLDGVSRIYNTPRILDEQVTLTDYAGPIRQIAIMDLGHEEPTLLLTNQLRRSRREAHRALCPTDADRKQHRRWRELLPHGRAVQRRGVEGQLRPSIDADGQQPVSLSWPAHRQRLRGGEVASSVPGFHRCHRHDRDRRA